MINVLNLFNWTTWLLIILVIILIFWLVYGGEEEYEFVGVKPLTTPAPLIGRNIIIEPKKEDVPVSGKAEDMVYDILQKLLNSEIKRNVRPDFLKNPETGKNLEIDCFCEEYSLAVEYNGVQHYKYPSVFHKNEREFYNQVYRDRLKRKLCDKHGIYLISIPYWVDIYGSQDEHTNTINENDESSKQFFTSRLTRYKRIYKYLYEKISEYFKIIFPEEQNGYSEDDSNRWGEYDYE